ncbi:hypothetical protein SKAU_G00330350 [Synaphobranchus kaupii]|uniref:Uncharacterized protein n=1 Tax=Synaphobranchus kaupii TaxID=118154 RepID=A0A9Q1EQI2_SYNKA|nr:hypothetical protein SKAU_G00330350 [Synaphobranchus kaupii]
MSLFPGLKRAGSEPVGTPCSSAAFGAESRSPPQWTAGEEVSPPERTPPRDAKRGMLCCCEPAGCDRTADRTACSPLYRTNRGVKWQLLQTAQSLLTLCLCIISTPGCDLRGGSSGSGSSSGEAAHTPMAEPARRFFTALPVTWPDRLPALALSGLPLEVSCPNIARPIKRSPSVHSESPWQGRQAKTETFLRV